MFALMNKNKPCKEYYEAIKISDIVVLDNYIIKKFNKENIKEKFTSDKQESFENYIKLGRLGFIKENDNYYFVTADEYHDKYLNKIIHTTNIIKYEAIVMGIIK